MSYELTQEKLSKANKKLLKDIHAHLNITKKELSNNQLMEMLNQAFFSKPSEEIKNTILRESKMIVDWGFDTYDIDTNKEVAKVQLLHYGFEKIITLNGEYYKSLNLNSNNETTFNELKIIANELAKTNKSYVKEVFLPEVLDEFDREDENNIIQIASEMGYFDYPKTIFELIEEHKVLINGEYSNFSLDDGWETEIATEYDDSLSDDIGDYVIWHPEIGFEKETNFKEFYFSYNDLCKAKKQSDGSWLINEFGNKKIAHIISFRSSMNLK